jgi:hypothetical protein
VNEPPGDEHADLSADARCFHLDRVLGIKNIDREFLDGAEQVARAALPLIS